jgi:copper transport protein
MAGAVTFRWAVIRRWPASNPAPLDVWSAFVARAGAWAGCCALLIAPVRLYEQARSLVIAGDPVLPMVGNVTHTMWGRGWMLQAAASLAMLTGLLFARGKSVAGWWLGLVSAVAVTLSPALMGHAVAAEHLVAGSVLVDWIHVAMAGAWIGSLTMLALIVRSPGVSGAAAATLIELFHPVAFACSAVLVATGVISLFLRVDHIADLLHSAYGAVLAVKLAFTLGVCALGLRHARSGARLARAGETQSVARSLSAETILAAVVIAATAVLVATAPPMP